jgi:large subunit ribosomal protein L37e
MTKGTSSQGKRKCRPMAVRKRTNRKKPEGTGRMRYMKNLPRRFKNGFRDGTQPKPRARGVDKK